MTNKLIADMSMSLDGFVADENDGVDEIFGWFGNGDVEIPTAGNRWTFKVSEASARHLRPLVEGAIGAMICGRRVFDLTSGWGGLHPLGCPVFVVSHSVPADWPADSAIQFRSTPAEALAAAREVAGERDIAVATPSLTREYLNSGDLDAISVSLVPVLLGKGIPFFAGLTGVVRLADPVIIAGTQVTHLFYEVIK